MSHSKKSVECFKCGFYDLCMGSLLLFFPGLLLLMDFFQAFCYILVMSTASTWAVIKATKKNHPLFAEPLTNIDDITYEKSLLRKSELKECTFSKVCTILTCSVVIYYVLSVLFGAPLFELYTSTLYFSCLMTLLTVCPLLWYFFVCDSLYAVIKIFTKCDNVTELHLFHFTLFPILGAWFGAFPIPLDWDRPWQAWPITCCIGASLAYSAAHFFMAYRMFYISIKNERKLASNRSV